MNNVLVIGTGSICGAREHAFASQFAQSNHVQDVYVGPGNAGTALMNRAHNLDLDTRDHDAVSHAIEKYNIDLTFIGPEAPLVDGLADTLRSRGYSVFGPGENGAIIEGSKAWSKEFMWENNIPTAHAVITDDYGAALEVVAEFSIPVVVKADGLAAGKGVVVCHSLMEAENAIRAMMIDRIYGDAGLTVLIEQCLTGKEVSLIIFTDGETAYPVLAAHDYKRAYNRDLGPNTGGMGAYTLATSLNEPWVTVVMDKVINPALRGLRRRGIEYRGALYAGIMLTDDGPMVLEFNCRFGDPETQVILPMMKSDIFEYCMATAKGNLGSLPPLEWYEGACVGVVAVSGGYPNDYKVGYTIRRPTDDQFNTATYYAGAKLVGDEVVTAGGRVLTVIARGSDISDARVSVYKRFRQYGFHHKDYRTDIALITK